MYAAAFHTTRACVIGFAPVNHPIPPAVRVGKYEITPLAWRYGSDISADQAAANLTGDFEAWLDSTENQLQLTSVAI